MKRSVLQPAGVQGAHVMCAVSCKQKHSHGTSGTVLLHPCPVYGTTPCRTACNEQGLQNPHILHKSVAECRTTPER